VSVLRPWKAGRKPPPLPSSPADHARGSPHPLRRTCECFVWVRVCLPGCLPVIPTVQPSAVGGPVTPPPPPITNRCRSPPCLPLAPSSNPPTPCPASLTSCCTATLLLCTWVHRPWSSRVLRVLVGALPLSPPSGAVLMNMLEFILCTVYFGLEGYRVARSAPWQRALFNKGAKMRLLTSTISHTASRSQLLSGRGEDPGGPSDGGAAASGGNWLCPCLRLAPWAPLGTHSKSQKTAVWLGVLWQLVVCPAVALVVIVSDVLPQGGVRVGVAALIAMPTAGFGTLLPLQVAWRGEMGSSRQELASLMRLPPRQPAQAPPRKSTRRMGGARGGGGGGLGRSGYHG
jgi:hypothetical protein